MKYRHLYYLRYRFRVLFGKTARNMKMLRYRLRPQVGNAYSILRGRYEKMGKGGRRATLAALLLLSIPFLFRPFAVSGGSMEPTYHEGQYLLSESITPHLSIWRGEVLVIYNPHDHLQTDVKRVVGLPGEVIHMGAQGLTVNPGAPPCVKGAPLYISGGPCRVEFPTGSVVGGMGNDDFTMTLGHEDYMVLGDNRSKSEDSRSFGAVQQRDVIGHVILAL